MHKKSCTRQIESKLSLHSFAFSLPPNKYNIYIFMIMRTGDKVLISPDLTHAKDWTPGEVIEVENNPFVGIVISAKTADGNIFFGYKDLFEPTKEAVCTQ